MGSFSKKLKRNKVVEITKTIVKETEKGLKARNKGLNIAKSNLSRMNFYVTTYMGTCFAYIMRTAFKMPHKDILHMFNELDRHEEYLTTKEKWHQPLSVFKAGLYLECRRFRITPRNEWREPKEYDYVHWCEFFVHNTFLRMERKLETIWYWIMHDSFGFNRKRLDRCKELLQKFDGMTWKKFNDIWDFLGKVRVSKGCEQNPLNPERPISIMKQLLSQEDMDNCDMPMRYRTVNQAVRRLA